MVIAHIGMPIEPAKGVGSFSSSIHLRDAARRFIREHCNEPDLWAAASHEHMDVDRLRLDPGSMFASPQAVLDHTTLSVGDKIDVLGRWYYDAAEIAVAEEEGMPAHDDDLLRDIVLALEQLTRVDAEHVGPSKQHGLPDLWQDTSSGGPGVSS